MTRPSERLSLANISFGEAELRLRIARLRGDAAAIERARQALTDAKAEFAEALVEEAAQR